MKKIFVPKINVSGCPTLDCLNRHDLGGFTPEFLYRIVVETREMENRWCYATVKVGDKYKADTSAFVPFATTSLEMIRKIWPQLPMFSSLKLERVWMLSNPRLSSRAYPLDFGAEHREDTLKKSSVHVLLNFTVEDTPTSPILNLFSFGSSEEILPSGSLINRTDFLRHAAEEIKGAESKYTT